MVPTPIAVPDRRPTITPAGNLSLKRFTKRAASGIYIIMVCGYVLATVKEAFAVAPGLTRVRIVALRSTRIDAYGKSGVEAIPPFGLALRTHAPSPVLSQSWGWWPCARWRRRPVPLVLSACNVSPCRVDLLVLEQVNVVPEMWPDLPSGRVGIRLGKTST